ncbi:hypothetical protein F2Q70_00030548 [Brassica cretica]|uniref:Uncharacterized protein n=1 Tax=Brassica cretica TaxID=69181 RepID=A0A8S9FK30_BRACR|nr:hypothetical protein F2Q70_00030548 [Brassica cretica]
MVVFQTHEKEKIETDERRRLRRSRRRLRFLRQKIDRKPPQRTTRALLTASPPSSLELSEKDSLIPELRKELKVSNEDIESFSDCVVRCEDGAQSACSEATTNRADHPTARPPGVKASKGARGKRPMVDQQGVTQFQNMVSIKEKDMAIKEKDMALKERLSKMGLLGNLISKTKPLSEYEEALKQKLITEMLGD